MDLVSPIINIISKVWDCGARRTIYICELEENLNSLRSEMRKLRSERDEVKRKVVEAEEKQMKCREPVETWLQMVEEMEVEVELVINEGSQQISKMCLAGCCPKNCCSSYKIGKIVVEKRIAVTKLITEGNFSEVADPLTLTKVEEMPSRPMVGMDSMLENVWKCLTEEDEVGIIGIYGMRGVGKTSLLKKINNEFLHRRTLGFDVVIWVDVSKESYMKKVQKDIGDRLGLKLSEDETRPQEAARARVIFNVLSKKRFVVLLDDIWTRVDFDDVGIPRPDGQNKSKVVFTTESEAVSLRMLPQKNFKIECLGWNEAWDLFKKTVGKEALNSHHQIPELAARVALECDGLPPALVTIGETMASKKAPHEWNDAIKQLRKSASEEEAISMGPWGGGGGTYWSHNAKGGITQITITHGAGIDSLNFKTHDKGDLKFGGDGAPNTSRIDFDWPHEYLTSISGSYGTVYINGKGLIVVTSLRLITNKREFGPFGLEVGTPFSLAMKGGMIVGFHGRAGIFMDAIGVSVKPMKYLLVEDSSIKEALGWA